MMPVCWQSMQMRQEHGCTGEKADALLVSRKVGNEDVWDLRNAGDKFDSLINQYFKLPNPGSAKERTMLHAIETGKIQAGEAKLSGLRKEL